jgi:cyclophilin family peptidyl-prolyl cis-trans isomerase
MPLRVLVVASVLAAMTLGATGAAAQNPVVVMETSVGSITIDLDQEKAPISVENFLQYVSDGFYDGLVFHRVIQTFMIQGGGFDPDMNQKSGRPAIKNEATNGMTNARGTITMARTNVVDSATSQFFINTVDNARSLDHKSTDPQGYGYAVFGHVIDGMEVVDKIAAVPVGNRGPFQNVPNDAVVIQSVTVK